MYISEFRRFAAIFISFFFAPSVLEAPSVVEMVKDEELPGRLLAGAHYIFVPFGVIIYAMYWPEHTVDVAKEHLSSARDGMRDEREREVCEAFCQAARTMKRDNQELFSELKEIIHEWGDINLAAALEISIFADESIDMRCNPKELPSLDGLLSLGEVAWEKIKADSNEYTERLGIVMTRLCIELWSAIRQQPGHKRRWSKEGDTDFSACYIEKRRAIYVSNFQPSGEEGFTRTIFIDLALNGYQRGRVAQRLCDVATCRSLAVIDINRIRAIIGGMNELSIELNRLQELEVGIFANRGTDWKEQVDVCNKVIEGLDEIRQELDQMNWLVVYGMKGRYLAGNVLLSQIEDRIEDLAEDNFDGAQGLGEYLRRRVKEAMRDVNRMSEKYDYLRDRIRESFDRVRTRLNLIETSKTSDFARITAELAGSLLSIIKKLSDLDEAQGTWKVFANLSLIIAGTYTIMELLKDVAPHADLKISLVVTLFVVSMCVLILKIVTKRKK